MFESGCTPEEVHRATGLPMSTVNEIGRPILALREAEHEMAQAERRIIREQRREENKHLRAIQPCPLCDTGHAVPNSYTLIQQVTGTDGAPTPIQADVNYCECSNRRCVARLIYPRDSQEEAIEAFTQGRFAEPHPWVDQRTGRRLYLTRNGLEREVRTLLAEHPASEVKRLGLDPDEVDRIALELDWERMTKDPDAFDTTLMCPRCGRKGELRKAVNPVTHRRDHTCWWRAACPRCKLRTRHSFPTPEEAQDAFERNDLDRKPKETHHG